MQLKHLAVVCGTRPELIKCAPLLLECDPRERPAVVLVGQQHDTVDACAASLGIRPAAHVAWDRRTDWREARDANAPSIADALARLGARAVLVQGDTATVAAGARAARDARLPLVHLEAGLRSFDLLAPFPEESIRTDVARTTSLHLAPTVSAADNLEREGVDRRRIAVVGSTAIDALRQGGWLDRPRPRVPERRVLVTSHRREGRGAPQEELCRALGRALFEHRDLQVEVVLHPNERANRALRLGLTGHPRVIWRRPLPHAEFLERVGNALCAISDSGGLQEEAPSLGVPLLVTRDTTERPEAIACGTAELVGVDGSGVTSALERLLTDPEHLAVRRARRFPFGRGFAARAARRSLQTWDPLTALPARVQGPSLDRRAAPRHA